MILVELKKIANQENVRYIIGFPEIKYFLKNNDFKINGIAFLYDDQKEEIKINKSFENQSLDTKFKPNQDNTRKFQEAVMTVIVQFGKEMFDLIIQNTPNYKKPEKVRQARRDYLLNTLYHQEPNPEILEILFEQKRKLIEKKGNNYVGWGCSNDLRFALKKDTTDYFQGFFNNDKTRFVAFIVNKEKFGFQKDAEEKWCFEILAGILYQNKWYIEFTNKYGTNHISYFNVSKIDDLENLKKEYLSNLLHYDFFKNNNAELNSNFWRTHFFEDIQTDFSEEIASRKRIMKSASKFESVYIRQKKGNERIKDYERQTKENSPYKGLPKIVAEILKEEKKVQEENNYNFYQDTIYVNNWIFSDFEQDFKKSKYKPFASIEKLIKTYENIQPKEKPYCLVPFIAIDKKGNQTLRFFLFHKWKKMIYEWTYFQPYPIEKKYADNGDAYFENKYYMEELIDKKMIEWFGSIENEDISKEIFWQENVFKKKKDKYEFLHYVTGFLNMSK